MDYQRTGFGINSPTPQLLVCRHPVRTDVDRGGWSYGSAPIMNYDWKSEEWTVPLNFAVSKTVMFGKMPVKLELEANYYIEQPDLFGPEWMIGFSITPVVPNIFDRWIKGM